MIEFHADPKVTARHVLGGLYIGTPHTSGGPLSISQKMMSKSFSAGSPLLRTASCGGMLEQELYTPFTRLVSKDGRLADSGRYPDYYIDHGVGHRFYRRHTPRPGPEWGGTEAEIEAAEEKLHTMKRSYSETHRWPDSTFSRCIWHRTCTPEGGFRHPHTISGPTPAQRARTAAQHLRRLPRSAVMRLQTPMTPASLRPRAGLDGTDRIVVPNTSGPGGWSGCQGA